MGDRSKRGGPRQNAQTMINASQLNDEELTLHALKKLIVNLQGCFETHTNNINKKLDEHKLDMQKRLNEQTKSIEKLENALKQKIESEISNLRNYIDQEVKTMVARFVTIEGKIAKFEEIQKKADMWDYDTTVIVTNLPSETNEDLPKKVDNLIKKGLYLNGMNVVRVLRLQSRTQKPGLVKVQLVSLEEKIRLLKAKGNLKENEDYKKVFIRSSKPHSERVAEYNMNVLLNALPGLNKNYRLTGTGKLITRSPQQGPSNQLRDQRHSSPLNSSIPPPASFNPSTPPPPQPGGFMYNPHISYSPYDEMPSGYISRSSPQ